MMGKTHVAMGMAITTLVIYPKDIQSCLLAVAGGAMGGVLADIDAVKNDYKHDALIGQILAVVILGFSLLIDYVAKFGICLSIVNRKTDYVLAGAIGYLVLYIIGFFSKHRSFTHSILALALFTFSVYLICPRISLVYAVGYATHLLLDILNKKPVPIFYPIGKGVCLRWCYANKTANSCFMWFGFIGTVIIIIYALLIH